MLEADEIEKIIPHRYPFLLVDRMIEIEDGKRGVGIKNVTANEWFFEGHFPGNKVMPGVLIVEALAQTCGILCFVTADIYPGEMTDVNFYFAGIDKARFRRPVVPGDQLMLRVVLERRIRTIWKFSTVAEVDGVEVCSAGMMVMPG